MKKILFAMLMLVLAVSAFSTITYSTVTSKTTGKIVTYAGLTTVAVGDTATPYILSPTFTNGSQMSNKGIMITGVVVTALKHSTNVAQGAVMPVLQASYDGTTFADLFTFGQYFTAGGTAGTTYVIPVSLTGYFAPYYRVKWVGYSTTGVINTAFMFGTIRTVITFIP